MAYIAGIDLSRFPAVSRLFELFLEKYEPTLSRLDSSARMACEHTFLAGLVSLEAIQARLEIGRSENHSPESLRQAREEVKEIARMIIESEFNRRALNN